MEEAATNSKKQVRSGAWTRLKKRWNRKGVVEVDIDHYRYQLLNCIRNGIRDLITNFPELGPKVRTLLLMLRVIRCFCLCLTLGEAKAKQFY